MSDQAGRGHDGLELDVVRRIDGSGGVFRAAAHSDEEPSGPDVKFHRK